MQISVKWYQTETDMYERSLQKDLKQPQRGRGRWHFRDHVEICHACQQPMHRIQTCYACKQPMYQVPSSQQEHQEFHVPQLHPGRGRGRQSPWGPCFKCQGFGHVARNCYQPLQVTQQTSSQQRTSPQQPIAVPRVPRPMHRTLSQNSTRADIVPTPDLPGGDSDDSLLVSAGRQPTYQLPPVSTKGPGFRCQQYMGRNYSQPAVADPVRSSLPFGLQRRPKCRISPAVVISPGSAVLRRSIPAPSPSQTTTPREMDEPRENAAISAIPEPEELSSTSQSNSVS